MRITHTKSVHQGLLLGNEMNRLLVGIDEVGRGPLAGPVAVCAVVLRKNLPKDFLKNIRNSKALSETARNSWYKKAMNARKAGQLDFAVAFSNAHYIDTYGISAALRACIKRSLVRLNQNPRRVKVFLDGSLYAPNSYVHQETVIKGDEKIPVVSLASIIAKVRRDTRMRRYAKLYPGYGFEEHVGYGTAKHYKAIRAHGISDLHRRSFLKGLAR